MKLLPAIFVSRKYTGQPTSARTILTSLPPRRFSDSGHHTSSNAVMSSGRFHTNRANGPLPRPPTCLPTTRRERPPLAKTNEHLSSPRRCMAKLNNMTSTDRPLTDWHTFDAELKSESRTEHGLQVEWNLEKTTNRCRLCASRVGWVKRYHPIHCCGAGCLASTAGGDCDDTPK